MGSDYAPEYLVYTQYIVRSKRPGSLNLCCETLPANSNLKRSIWCLLDVRKAT